MLTSNTHQKSLADAGSETRPPMLERGSYIPWASRFRRYLNRKRETRKFLNNSIDNGPYVFKTIKPNENEDPRPKTEDDLTGDALKQFKADIEAMNLILISIRNDIYNSVDACQTTQEMWLRVERLMQGTALTVVDRETRFNNEFDHFTAEPGESLVSVYNHFAQLMNDLKRNKIDLPTQYEKIVIASRVKKLEKTHDPLALVAHTSSSRSSHVYYATHPSSVVDYDDEYQGKTFQNDPEDSLTSAMMLLARAITTQRYSTLTNNRLRSSSNTRNQAVVQADRVNFQSKNVGNDGRIARRSYNVQEETAEGSNVQMRLRMDKEIFKLLREMSQMFSVTTATRKVTMLLEELSVNICMMARIQPANIDSDEGPSYDSAFISEVQTPSTSYMNPLFTDNNHEQTYPEQPKIINSTIGNDQINSNIIFDNPYVDVNNGSVDHDKHVHASYELEQLARNTYKETEKQQFLANKMNADEDKYLDDILNLEAKKAIAHNPKLYDASSFNSFKVHVSVCDTEEILEDATKSQIKMENKLKDPVAIEKKQNFRPIDYKKLNALYETFVPQVKLSAEQKYFPFVSITSGTPSNASTSSSPPATMPKSSKIMKHFHRMERDFEKLFTLLKTTSTPKSIFFTITLQTSPTKKKQISKNNNVIASGMYKVTTTNNQEVCAQKAKSVLTSTRLKDVTSVRRPSSRSSLSNNSVLSNTKDHSEEVKVHVRTNKKTNIASKKNVVQNKKIVTNVDVTNAPKAKDVFCVSCDKNVLTPCHNKCLAKYKLNVHSNVRRALFTTHGTTKSKSLDTTPVVSKTSGCSKHMTGDLSLLKNFLEKFMGIVCFGNDHFAAITGYGDYVHGNITICHVYYVEGLGHNLFSVGQFCDGDLEVAFRSKTCYVQNLEGDDDLLASARESNLYTISISDMTASSPVCLMSKATSTKSWLWHRRLSHLNFGTINDLTKQDLVDGLSKFKYDKDHLCSACEQGKSRKSTHPHKLVPSTHSKLELIHMDLCGPMRVESINGKKYILVIVDDNSRYTWVYFRRTEDETPEMIKKFIAQVQLNFNVTILKVRTDNGTEFKNAILQAHYEKLGIMQQFSITRTPQQNGVVERRNRTLVEAARTMLIFSKSPEFLWAEAISTACFTQNRSLIHTRYNKTPYELLCGRKPNVKYFHVFESLCYLTNDRKDLGKMKPKANIGIFIGYSESFREFQIYKKNYGNHPLENNEAPPLASSFEEQISPISSNDANELVQEEDSTIFDGNTLLSLYYTPMFKEAESSSIAKDPSEMQVITPVQPSTHVWTKAHPLDQVIGDPSRLVMTRSKLSTDLESSKSKNCTHAINQKLVSWSSKKQDCTALSTTEAEYVSLSACCAQFIWMRTQLFDYGYKLNIIPMYCDSKSAIAISCNPAQHSHTKHIDIRYHFIKEHVERGTVELYFIGTEYQLANLFTKSLPKEHFEYLVHRIGMRCMTPTQLERLAKSSS
ncbi:retrovirus-related pol polyprotein from transposon TNT 1-94 [Tanacetum coccineum]